MLDLNKMLIYYLQSYNINHTCLFVQQKVELSMWWKKYPLPSKSNEFVFFFSQVGKLSETERGEYDPGENLKYDDLVNTMTTSIPKMGQQACIQVMTDSIYHSEKIKMNIHKAVSLCNMKYINKLTFGTKIIK